MDVTAIGMVEFNSIAQGIDSTDAMCKIADVTLLVSKTVCPGKYISIVAGDTSAVQQAVHAGEDKAPECTVDSFIIPNIHKSLIPAIAGTSSIENVRALGLIECFSVATPDGSYGPGPENGRSGTIEIAYCLRYRRKGLCCPDRRRGCCEGCCSGRKQPGVGERSAGAQHRDTEAASEWSLRV